MRHLHYSADDERSLCGHRLRVPVRTGSRVIWVPGVKGVHFSKARKSDCAECRKLFRQQLRTARELSQAGQKHTFRIVYEQIETRPPLVLRLLLPLPVRTEGRKSEPGDVPK